MLWDPGSVEKDDEEGREKAPVTPILVPLQNKPSTVEKSVPVLVPDVQDLKDQFQQQQSMLTQIKETLMQNETQLSSKGKQMEAYANKLSQIRARSKNSQGSKKPTGAAIPSSPKMQKKSSKENLTRLEASESEKSPHKHRKGKVSELKKCLEENKIKFEQRTGKELSETKKIESLVEQLKQQLEERDRTIHDLQKNIEEPTPKFDSLAKFKPKPKDSVASKTTQTTQSQPTGDSSEIIALQNKILELEANVLDLEENLKEKESVIEARTQAVTLLSQDLSLKGKNTLESLEETRQEMRTMQNNFIAIEDQLKKDLIDRDNRLEILSEKCKRFESTNFELSLKNAELQEKLVNLQTKYLEADAERKSLKESTVQGQPDDRLDELTKKINDLTKELDNRNKSMIKMKVEHKNKIKNLNKTLDTLKGASDEKAEIVRLSSLLEEFESVKTGLENRVAELEDEKVSEKKLKDQINELEIIIQKQNEDLDFHLKTISNLEKDKLDLIQSTRDQNVLIENLQARIADVETIEGKLKEMTEKMKRMEEEHNKRIEELKGDHWKEIEMLESYYNAKGESLDKKALEEYRISTEINNIHVEEQIELLIREKQQLLEKLKSLSGVSSTDSLTFEKMEHSDLKDDKEIAIPLGEEDDIPSQNVQVNRSFHLEKIVSDQQLLITDLQNTIAEEKEKVQMYQQKVSELEDAIKHLEEMNLAFKQQIDLSEATESGKNTKTSTNTKNRIKKIEMELTQSKRTVQEQSEKLKELCEKLQEKEELIKKYTEKIELFEKDDWDRQNHWKNTEDDIETVQELQKKCLSLENSLFELNEDCERLRKENIEVVHLLSEEKVKRRKLLEELDATPETNNAQEIETRIETLNRVIKELEERIEKLESNHWMGGTDSCEVAELQEKLEWTNVVLTSKETEMFRLQNLLEDRNNTIEMLEIGLKEYMTKLDEKEKKIKEMSENFDKLQKNINIVNEKSTTNEKQLEELLTIVKETEGTLFRKEKELEEMKGILADKNLKIKHLQNRLEEVDNDLSYKQRLENMEKSLREKESDYNVFLSEKAHLEEINRSLITEKEEILNQKLEISQEKDELKSILLEKEKLVAELNEKIQKGGNGAQEKNQNIEDLKIKMKKLAANLKKKAQNEADLLKQVEELEAEVKDVNEKWTMEKMEKEKMSSELEEVKTSAGMAKAALEKELENLRSAHEEQVKELGRQIQVLQEACSRLEVTQQEDKEKMKVLEEKIAELENQNAELAASQNQHKIQQEIQTLLQKLAETTGKYEEMKFRHDQVLLERCETEKRLEEMMKIQEEFSSEKSGLQAKIQENFAVIENLELELKKTLDQLKVVEEKFFYSEDRRLSLENKNEDMCKKIMENSENLITIDDLAIRVEELLKSEKTLQNFVKILESGNAELKQTLDQLQTEKQDLQKELKASGDKMAEVVGELSELKNSDGEKSSLIRELTKEVERLKAENKLISLEFQKLNQDYEQFENDFKENLENSQNVEKSLRHKIEELLNENVQLTEKCNLLSEVKPETKPEEEEKKPKKRKSVTFRTDETEYIKDLKNQLHSYDANLKEANEEIENLKAELFRERLRHEVTDVLTEAQEKVVSLKSSSEKKDTVVEMGEESPTERKFDANTFFGNDEEPFLETKQSSEFDSLMWDDGWGAEGHLEAEYLSGKVENERMKTLETEINSLEAENERLRKELQEQTGKYAKAIKKLKEVKTAHDKLQFEVSKLKSSSGLGVLDEAITEELKSQIERMEAKEKELLKNLENAKLEKDALLKRIDVLNAGNEKFVEMKERQDNEVEIWQRKNNELLRDIAELRQKLENPVVLDDKALMAENRELKNKVEALEWKNCELNELLEEQQELLEGNTQTDVRVMEEKSQLHKEIDELNSVKERLEKKLFDEEKKNTMAIEELNEQLTALASENETLQSILGEMKKTADAAKQSKIIDYFKSSPGDVFPVNVPKQTDFSEVLLRQKEEEIASVRQQLSEAENAIKLRDEQKLEKENEIVCLRHSIVELENLIKLKEMENSQDQFETIDLNPNAEIESLRARVVDLEGALAQREDELQHLHQTKLKEMEELRERIFQLEDVVRSREDELNRITGNEMDILKRKIIELEELARFKEAELYQIQSASGNEIQNLNQKIFELENALRFKEDESRAEVAELENVLLIKDKEIERLANRVMELEKSYNDSKQEIERLLNEENLNIEEKFVEPFQSNMKIPVAFEVEALSRTLNEEKQKSENLLYELSEKENLLTGKNDEVTSLSLKVSELKERLEEESNRTEESNRMKAHLERMISELQKELESSNFHLSVARRELEEFQSVKDEAMENLKSQMFKLESELVESRGRERTEVEGLKCELEERKKRHEEAMNERGKEEEKAKANLEREMEMLRKELKSKEEEIEGLSKVLAEERSQVEGMRMALEEREREVADLKETLAHLQEEIGHFRNFEKQVKELRVAQIKESGSEVNGEFVLQEITPEGHPDLSDWSEHELAELSSRLQSDLDTALYMLHQRDVRCDELTFELMQLLEERDTLQLRLSTALRINEELRAAKKQETTSASQSLQESKDLVDQSNDRQGERGRVPSEDLRQLANKISELHSVSYLRDKTVKDDSVQRHKEQMNLLSRVSDSDISLSRDVQSSPAVLLNWMRGKTTPKVMHI